MIICYPFNNFDTKDETMVHNHRDHTVYGLEEKTRLSFLQILRGLCKIKLPNKSNNKEVVRSLGNLPYLGSRRMHILKNE